MQLRSACGPYVIIIFGKQENINWFIGSDIITNGEWCWVRIKIERDQFVPIFSRLNGTPEFTVTFPDLLSSVDKA
jgi:hypothetical protein